MKSFPFVEWWNGVLRLDEERVDPLLACVFCGENLANEIRRSVRDHDSVAMLAWWQPGEWSEQLPIGAAGLYCHGTRNEGRCLETAEMAGYLLDVHAEHCCGCKAMPQLTRIAAMYPWDGAALRRLTLVCGALARITPGSK